MMQVTLTGKFFLVKLTFKRVHRGYDTNVHDRAVKSFAFCVSWTKWDSKRACQRKNEWEGKNVENDRGVKEKSCPHKKSTGRQSLWKWIKRGQRTTK